MCFINITPGGILVGVRLILMASSGVKGPKGRSIFLAGLRFKYRDHPRLAGVRGGTFIHGVTTELHQPAPFQDNQSPFIPTCSQPRPPSCVPHDGSRLCFGYRSDYKREWWQMGVAPEQPLRNPCFWLPPA